MWEAKGGSNRREQALKKGSQQISDIESVNGNVPAPAAVCMTYYDHSYLCGVVRQPESDRKEKKRVFYVNKRGSIQNLLIFAGFTAFTKNTPNGNL